MDINIDKMVEQQEKLNAKIADEAPIKEVEEEGVVYYDKGKCTQTHIVHYKGSILLTRYMFNKIYKVAFNETVLAKDIVDYMELGDSMFVKMSLRS